MHALRIARRRKYLCNKKRIQQKFATTKQMNKGFDTVRIDMDRYFDLLRTELNHRLDRIEVELKSRNYPNNYRFEVLPIKTMD